MYWQLSKYEFLSLAFYFYFVVKTLEFCEKDSVFSVVGAHPYAPKVFAVEPHYRTFSWAKSVHASLDTEVR